MIDANGNINEDEDILENIDLVAKEKQKEINKLREKAKLPVYDDHALLNIIGIQDWMITNLIQIMMKKIVSYHNMLMSRFFQIFIE